MDAIKLTFAGYNSGETDFASLLEHTQQTDLETLRFIVTVVQGLVTPPETAGFVSIVFTGHADPNSTENLSEQARRASERDTAEERTLSALSWFQEQVAQAAAAEGHDPGNWWEGPKISIILGSCGAVWPVYSDPTDAQRPLNRRVVIVVSIFNP